MLSIAVCDDAALHAAVKDLIEETAAELPEECRVCGVFSSAAQVLDYLKKGSIDLLILEIELGGLGGFDLAARLNRDHREIIIIFVSSNADYVFRSFEFEPFRFIRKSRLVEELPPALRAAAETLASGRAVMTVNFAGGGTVSLREREILYFESSRNYLVAHTSDGEAFKFRGTVKKLLEQLKSRDFCRVHRSFVINLREIRCIEGRTGVLMKDGASLPVSTRLTSQFERSYTEFTNRRSF